MSQSALPESAVNRKKILRHWTRDKDVCAETVEDSAGHRLEFGILKYRHTRVLPKSVAIKAHNYITVLVAGYPFQLRYAMAIPLWDRFCEEWCLSGDEAAALRAI